MHVDDSMRCQPNFRLLILEKLNLVFQRSRRIYVVRLREKFLRFGSLHRIHVKIPNPETLPRELRNVQWNLPCHNSKTAKHEHICEQQRL